MMDNKDKDKTTFQKLWENPQSKAGIKLLLYFVFIGFIILTINAAATANSVSVKEKPKITIQDMKDYLKDNNYQYEHIVVFTDGTKTIFKGNVVNNENEGTKETIEKTTKYLIDDTGIYETILGEKTIIDNLYENIDENLLDIKYVLDLINDKSTLITTREGKKEYNYTFNIDDNKYEIILRTDNKEIYNVYINYNETIYDLNFSNVGD